MAAPSPPPLPRSFKRSAPSERERESSPVSRLTGKKVIARLEATRHRPRTSFAPLHHHPFLPSFLDIANVSPSSVGERPSTPRFHSRNTHIHIHSSRHTAANTQREGKRPHTHTAAADAQQQTHREKKRDHTHTHTHNTERAANTQREEERPHTHTRARTEGGRSPLSRIPFPLLPLLFSFYALVSLISFQPVSISHPLRMRRRISISCEESIDFVFGSILR